MADLSTSFKIFTEKRNKASAKFNSFRERFEKRKKSKTADLKEAGEVVEKMYENYTWRQRIP
jgi:hypothetical protein